MILTEPDLTFRLRMRRNDPMTGGACSEYQCVQHPRLTLMVQRPNRDAACVETYHVDGIAAQFYRTAATALEAMEANPK